MADIKNRSSNRGRRKNPRQPNVNRSSVRQAVPVRPSVPAGQSPPGRRLKSSGPMPPSIGDRVRDRAFKRNKSRSRSASFTAGIFILAAIIYIAQSAYVFFNKPHIATELVEVGSVALPKTMSGVIIRDEDVYKTSRDGQVAFTVGDYEKVKAGAVVCSIQNTEAVEEINEEKATLEEQIMEYQAMRQDISSIDPAVRRLNDQISNIVETSLYAFTSNDISHIYSLRDDISQMVDTRDTMIVNENYNVRNELGTQHQQLLSRLEQNTDSIAVARGGLMSPVVDGAEELFTLENMKDLTREQAAFKVDYNNVLLKKEVKAEEPVFKIVASNNWYIGVYIPNELTEDYAADDRRVMYLESPEKEGEYVPVNMVVEYISKNYSDSYVLFRCNKNIIDYLNTRNINIRTSDSVRTGFKISNTAITTRSYLQLPLAYVTKTEKQGNYVLANIGEEGLIRIPVIIMDEDENFAYVSADAGELAPGVQIKLGDLPLYTIAAAVEVPGVYRVNNGYAEFIRITLNEEKDDDGSGYTLLDPAFNHGIKSYDYIVVNAADIVERQIIS